MLLKLLALLGGPVTKVLLARLALFLEGAEQRVKEEHAYLDKVAKEKHEEVEKEAVAAKELAVRAEVRVAIASLKV